MLRPDDRMMCERHPYISRLQNTDVYCGSMCRKHNVWFLTHHQNKEQQPDHTQRQQITAAA